MTSKKTLFDTPPSDKEVGDKPTSEDSKSFYAELVGEGKKFKDNEALARGKYESDEFIGKLQSELDEMRKELNTRMSLEEFWDRTKSSPNQNSGTQPPNNNGNGNNDMTNTPKTTADDEAIRALVAKALESELSAQKKRENVISVRAELIKTWGSDYQRKINDRAETLGTNADFLASIAETQPKVFLELMRGNNEAPKRNNADVLNAPRSSVVPGVSGNGNVTNKAYFDKIRKENPRLYWSAETQQRMYLAAKELGDLFYKS